MDGEHGHTNGEDLLRLQDLSISFGGITGLAGVSLGVKPGQVHALIGPNGAGKTTLLNCVSRFYRQDRGSIVFKGEDLSPLASHEIASRGIARTFQNIELFKHLTVMDNLLLGRHTRRRTGFLADAFFWGRARRQEVDFRRQVEETIDFLDLQAYRDVIIDQVPYGVQKNVELARALVMEPTLLLLDEPASGLNVEETQDLAFWIEDIKDELGITILLVEHDMRLVVEVSDRVTVLEYGMVLADGPPREVIRDPRVIQAYLGED